MTQCWEVTVKDSGWVKSTRGTFSTRGMVVPS